jgi:hypothetical protein
LGLVRKLLPALRNLKKRFLGRLVADRVGHCLGLSRSATIFVHLGSTDVDLRAIFGAIFS